MIIKVVKRCILLKGLMVIQFLGMVKECQRFFSGKYNPYMV